MTIIVVLQAITAIFLIISILLQMQGSGLSQAFGGSGDVYRSKRSMEKVLVIATIALSSIFAVLSIILLTIR